MTVSKVNPGTGLLGTMRGGISGEVHVTGQVDAGSGTGGGSDRGHNRSADVILELQAAAHPDQLASKLEQSFAEARAHAEALGRELAQARAASDHQMLAMVEQSLGAYLLVASLAAARSDSGSTAFVVGQAERMITRASGSINSIRFGIEGMAGGNAEAAAAQYAELQRKVATIAAHARAIAALAAQSMRGHDATQQQARMEEMIHELEQMMGNGGFIGEKLVKEAVAKLDAARAPVVAPSVAQSSDRETGATGETPKVSLNA